MKILKVTKFNLFLLCFTSIAILFFLVVYNLVSFISKLDGVIIESGTDDVEYIENKYSIILPKNTIDINHYSEISAWQSSVLYMRVTLHELNHGQKLLDDLENISGIDTKYVKGNDNDVDIPFGKNLSWWNPEVLGNLEYYVSEEGHHNVRFWIDRNNKYIYLYDSD